MGYGYSIDLRERVVAHYERGATTEKETAELFAIGEASVRRWRRLKRETGRVAPRPPGGGFPARVQGDGEQVVLRLVNEAPDRTIEELTEAFARQTGGPISTSSMSRTLIRLGLTRKKRLLKRANN